MRVLERKQCDEHRCAVIDDVDSIRCVPEAMRERVIHAVTEVFNTGKLPLPLFVGIVARLG